MIRRILRVVAAGVLCALAAFSGALPARAERLALPAGLSAIGEEAFRGNAAVTEVIVPQGTASIGDYAFADCPRLGWITVPESVEALGDGVFDGCAEDLLIRTAPGSAAMIYARLSQIDYQADTTYRALLVGQTYPDRLNLRLTGPANDVAALKTSLERFRSTPYDVTVKMNLTADGIVSAIDEVFGGAGGQDVSLFYYSGHGVESDDASSRGALLGADGYDSLTADELRAALDGVPGRKIVVIDSCYSGNFLTSRTAQALLRGANAVSEPEFTNEDFAASFISAFSVKKRRGLAADDYFVITAAAADEESFEDRVNGVTMGYFTAALCEGCGYFDDSGSLPADVNLNGVISFEEIYDYARASIQGDQQHAQVYPSGCAWFGMLRRAVAAR